MSLGPGDSVLQRLFDIPVSTPAGQYGVWLALYDSFPQHTPDHVYADLGMYRFLVTVR